MERERIARHIKAIAQCGDDDSTQLAQLFEPHPLKKGDVFQLDQVHSRSIFFLSSGIVQLRLLDIAKEQAKSSYEAPKTLAIYQPTELFFFPFGNPTDHLPYHFQAITTSLLFLANYGSIEKLIEKRPNFIRHYVSIGENYLKHTFHHIRILQQPTAMDKYQQIRQHFGKHFYLIPYQIQASYMGISRKHLSRVTHTYLKQKEGLRSTRKQNNASQE